MADCILSLGPGATMTDPGKQNAFHPQTGLPVFLLTFAPPLMRGDRNQTNHVVYNLVLFPLAAMIHSDKESLKQQVKYDKKYPSLYKGVRLKARHY